MFHTWAEISKSHQAENCTPKSLLLMPDHLKLTTQKSQNVTRPANPEETPSKPMPKPTPEHPVGHSNTPTQKDTAWNFTNPQYFWILPCRFLF